MNTNLQTTNEYGQMQVSPITGQPTPIEDIGKVPSIDRDKFVGPVFGEPIVNKETPEVREDFKPGIIRKYTPEYNDKERMSLSPEARQREIEKIEEDIQKMEKKVRYSKISPIHYDANVQLLEEMQDHLIYLKDLIAQEERESDALRDIELEQKAEREVQDDRAWQEEILDKTLDFEKNKNQYMIEDMKKAGMNPNFIMGTAPSATSTPSATKRDKTEQEGEKDRRDKEKERRLKQLMQMLDHEMQREQRNIDRVITIITSIANLTVSGVGIGISASTRKAVAELSKQTSQNYKETSANNLRRRMR